MSRLGRYMLFCLVWFIPLFLGGDIAWRLVAHHPIPGWVIGLRLAVWCDLLVFEKVPGYQRFVRDRGQKSSDVIPQSPTVPLVGWRAWRSNVGLRSLTTFTVWPSSCPYEARCPSHHEPPGPDCQCGVYVFSNPSDARHIRLSARHAVYGPVLTWGRTQVHEAGWRSQYAQPLALVRPRFLRRTLRQRMDLILERLGREYGVPVLSLKDAKALAERFRTSSEG